ncbi:nitroreductase family protein [Blastocystis sp. subtype 4]|uniref:nitroreductase family protein n=1 Tax=Blastocystis sp. subtype 4 TaxID=944170 RepID=UPI0007114C19|nr:nitroreductase family protein [Blastocystis sp. subtype 4]KNB44117.1 nitroreductase family protein [Blastocystis sp. subtype 4]|eukprot:XP_014527555.1 nitroreductase family protein [Blastocystis sp. subtype 4]
MDFECMKKIVEDRHSVRVFKKQEIPENVLETILGYSLRCPTSMNTQPFKMILVRDEEKKEQLACCMDEGNDMTVRTSAATVVVCADQDPVKSVKEFGQYVFSSVESPKVKKMIRYGQYHSCLLPLAFLMYYKNSFFSFFFGWILDLAFAIYRLFSASPARLTTQAWSYQQASFLMQDLVILAESKGISSLIMEGFKEQQVRECLKLPKRYQIAGILSFGYEPDNTLVKPSARFPFDDF